MQFDSLGIPTKTSAALVLERRFLLLADFDPAWFEMWRDTPAEVVVVGVPQPDASRYGTLTFSDDHRLTSFEEKRPGQGVINAGIYLFRPTLLRNDPT